MFQPTDFLSSFKWWPVRNQHGTDAPPHAALMVTGVADGCVTVSQPDADGKSPALVLFNGPGLFPAGAEGQATSDPGGRAKYATGDGTPAAGETWGTGAASWELRKGKSGFVAWGGADGGSAVFVPDLSATAGTWTPPEVMTDWQCVDNAPVITTKFICRDGSLVDDPADCP